MENLLTIGQVAKRTNVTIRTLHYYDKIDLLKSSEHSEGGVRLYTHNDLNKLRQIQSLKFLGLSLKEIAGLLKDKTVKQADIEKIISYKREEILEEIDEKKKTVEKLNVMSEVIHGRDYIYLDIFCFIVYAMIWEEENKAELDGALPFLQRDERVKLDKEYFDIYVELKQFASKEVPFFSEKAQNLIRRLEKVVANTLSIDKHPVHKDINLNIDLYNPFSEKEKRFIENAYNYYRETLS